ncbi:MAG: hypothetical protein OEY06_07990 [Gammaproteobacteria bacterium]|nr:hypothetical protein [Gammaproteobacteria bacterium]MDH5388375.1 hypothetical protein [Gammaproteobacteria bacterium]
MFEQKFKPFLKIFIAAFLVFGLVSCTFYWSKSKYLDDREEQGSILIYGYINDKEAPFTMKWGDVKQVRPVSDEPYKELRSNNEGLFYLENLPTGLYKIATLSGPEKGLSESYWDWTMPSPSDDKAFKRMELKANKPGLYFVGSYKIDKVKDGGLFGTDKYETIATKEVSEKEALQMLLVYADNTKWKKIIQKRIKQLK